MAIPIAMTMTMMVTMMAVMMVTMMMVTLFHIGCNVHSDAPFSAVGPIRTH